jgi:hypothetical protein
MNTLKPLILATSIAACLLALSGCSTTVVQRAKRSLASAFSVSEAVKTAKTNYKATDPKTVVLYYDSSKPSHKYKIIGRVNADIYSFIGTTYSENNIREKLKARAANIGGNAVINLHRSLTTEMGNVVRYTN